MKTMWGGSWIVLDRWIVSKVETELVSGVTDTSQNQNIMKMTGFLVSQSEVEKLLDQDEAE